MLLHARIMPASRAHSLWSRLSRVDERDEHLARYLAEAELFSHVPWPERRRLLAEVRSGNEPARKHLIESFLLDVARIAIAHDEPRWMVDVDKIQEANLVLFRVLDDPAVDDVLDALKTRIPARLNEIARTDPGSPV